MSLREDAAAIQDDLAELRRELHQIPEIGLDLPRTQEKVLAALQAGIGTVMLPARNRRDFEEIPEDARKRLTFVWLENVDDALRTAIGFEPARTAAAA